MSDQANQDNKALLQSLKEGDAAAFNTIYDLYWKKLYYVAHLKLQDQDAAEDIVQDVFLILWKKRTDLEIKCLSTYLAAMVRYAIYRYLAASKGSRMRETVFHDEQDKYFDAVGTAENKSALDRILKLSNQLPDQCRLVFQYSKLHDLSLSEVSKKLNISQKTVEAHLTKALKIIRHSVMIVILGLFL